jgi:hypothetical protein
MDKQNRADAFRRAAEFGDLIYKVLQKTDLERHTMRFLVV